MKKQILRIFREAGEEFVSGQSLCKHLGVTRQAVWKNIGQLKEYGYEIESVSNKGYRLVAKPDKLYGPELESYLEPESFCKRIECYDCIDSTNLRAKQLAETGEPEGTLVVADEQTAGRGRRGRGWASEPGVGIWMSMVLRPALEPVHVPGLTLIAALAVNRSIREICGVDSRIKWPNDIILDGKKICGILTEMSSEVNYVHYAVTGIGINANTMHFPEEITATATSIYQQNGKRVDRAALIGRFANVFGAYYERYVTDGDLGAFVEEYDQMLANRDQQVKIYHGMVEDADPSEIETGIARGIDKTGALLVEMDGHCEAVVSGEVSVRGIYGYV
ncbi:MAG: biotin--[acetyl-CoA-carboxylase] ligase [Eubacteriales bacterium]|nr:biotin--[acetyl-CoA-carboxylase] ligase [Eubacteriales bacterium]